MDLTVRADDGIRLRATGAGDVAASVAVVLLHGWTLDSRLWRHQVADLPGRVGTPVRVVTYDARGHGRSGAARRDSAHLEQLADDLRCVLTEVAGDSRVVLVGHSMGGMTVLEYAARHSAEFAARVGGVVLISTTAEGTRHTRYGLGVGAAYLVRGAEIGVAQVLARGGAWRPHRAVLPALAPALSWLLFGDPVDPDALRLTVAMVGGTPLVSIGGFRPSIGRHSRVDALHTMAPVPVTIMVGARDRLTPPPCATSIADALPHAGHVVVPDAGHMLPLERPDLVTDAIAAVVRQATRGRDPDDQSGPSTRTPSNRST
ncbi:MAG TPA: alpha/beta hydrolase [Micromonosporaceae bacterium]